MASLAFRVARPTVMYAGLRTRCSPTATSSPATRRGFITTSQCWRTLPSGWERRKTVSYDELKPVTQQPSDEILIVDVREPEEVIQGNIPSSVNLPLSSLEQTLRLDNDSFLRQNGFPKPSPEQPMIFYCRSGKRSATALDVAKSRGYSNVRNYEGSWLDWEAREQNTK